MTGDGKGNDASGGALDATAASDPALDETAATGGAATPLPRQVRARGDKFGRFMVIDQLGAGAMGVVLAAYDPDLDRKVALKVLRDTAGVTDGTEGRARMVREAQAMAKLAHPNVVTVFEVGVAEGSVFIAMELVDGGTLTRWLRAADRPRAEILARFDQAGRGLAAAHAAGLVHRDFKPDNALVGTDGRVRVSDFGLVGSRAPAARGERKKTPAPHQNALTTSLTMTGAVMGTPVYMAPEQHAAEATDARSDQFSFCVALYEALHGERPFAGTTYGQIAETVLAGKVSAPPAGSSVPEWLRAVLLKGLSVEPADRFASMDELLEALRRDPTAARRRKRTIAAIAGLTVMAAGAIGFAVWRRGRIVTETCANIAFRREVPVCIGEAGGDHHRPVHWRLTSRRGDVLRAERVNGLGQLVDDAREGTLREYHYGANGQVQEVIRRDQFGELQQKLTYTNDLSRLEIRDKDGNPQSLDGSEVTVILQELDDRGFAVRQRHVNAFGTPRPDANGVYGYRYEFDDNGQWVAREALDTEGRAATDRAGVAITRQRFDERGDIVEVTSFGLDGKPIGNQLGTAVSRTLIDAHGNRTFSYVDVDGKSTDKDGCVQLRQLLDDRGLITRHECLDASGALTLDARGKAYSTFAYDARGDRTEHAVFDAAGKPVLDNGVWKILWGHDEQRRVTETQSLDVEGKPTLSAAGYARTTRRHDTRGNLVEEAFFGIDRRPATDASGVATYRRAYDARGSRTELAAFSAAGTPTLAKSGCAVERWTFDERNRERERRCFGIDGKPARDRTGVAITLLDLDDLGRTAQIRYLDPAGAPTPGGNGAPIERFRYDARGNAIESSWHAADEALLPNNDKYAVERRSYDDRGNLTELAYLGADRKPTMNQDRISMLRQTWDAQGHRIKVAYFSTDGAPMLHPVSGVASEETRYDARGRATEWIVRDVDGAAIPSKSGFARKRFVFDDRGLDIEHHYLGPDGQLTVNTDGYAVYRATYNERRQATRIELFGTDGKPAQHREGRSRVDRTYDAQGRITSEATFDVAGNPIETMTSKFDTLGRETERRWFGPDGKPIQSVDLVAAWTARHDHRGKVIELAYFGVDGKPKLTKEGFARTTAVYDDRGNRLEHAFFGLTGEPIAPDGAARKVTRYDEHDLPVEHSMFGVDGKPALGPDGFARQTLRYDDRGNLVEMRMFGLDGRPVLGKTGVASWVGVYNAADALVDKRAFGVDGKPIAWKDGDGVARFTTTYNARGEMIEVAHFDVEGKPGPDVAVVKYERDGAGRLLVESYFGANGLPMDVGGIVAMHLTYDARGNLLETAFRGPTGEPVARRDGYAFVRDRFDARDQMIERRILDARERLVATQAGWAMLHHTYWTSRPTILMREIGTDVAGQVVIGSQTTPEGIPFKWRRVGGRFYSADGVDWIAGKPLDAARDTLARAAVAGFTTSQLRATRPELFRGARGVLITEVLPKLPGEAAGLRTGDVVVELAGVKIQREDDFAPKTLTKPASLVLIRDGASVTLEIQPGRQGVSMEAL